MKVPKVEELLVEEWGQLKPTQAGMSAYSLHSYLKRFDNLKAELVGAQEEVRRRIFLTFLELKAREWVRRRRFGVLREWKLVSNSRERKSA